MTRAETRRILIHRRYGRESTVCGRGQSRPAFITDDAARVTCPRCRTQKWISPKRADHIEGGNP